ncbi:uncharacterized protein [Polyergus mexicanus]|uniref:uncharacterized protein n=1 Tax=Polyergus mexicanus TaxID=615972 RepID=UPI0038B4D44A
MQEIADQGYIEEDALIQYIVDGIPDEEGDKTLLYEARTLRELKKKLEVYDRIKEKVQRKKTTIKKDGSKDDSRKEHNKSVNKQSDKKRCFNCGSTEHDVKNCTNADKGPKCFKCNNFGHIALKYQQAQSPGASTTTVSCINTTDDKFILVDIAGLKCRALIDTGSDISLMRYDIYKDIGEPKLNQTTRVFTGLGNVITRPKGTFQLKLTIGNDTYEIAIYVVSTNSMTAELILGYNFLRNTEIIIRKGQIELVANYQPKETVKTTIETKILLMNTTTVYLRPRRLAPKEKDVLNNQIREWLATSIIKPSTIKKESQKYTAFVTPTGQYEFMKTPFGLCNSPTNFLRFIDEVFRDLIQETIVFTYMDDLIVPEYDEKDAFDKLEKTLAVAASTAFTRLKDVLLKEPVLRIYDPNAITELHTDASKQGYGTTLLQRKPEEKYLHPVYYMSNKTSDSEKKWCSYELEIVAIIKAVKKFRVYLLGIKFKIVTDCQAFQKTLSKENLPPKIARWALVLEEFEYDIEHRHGDRMKHVNALSRYPVMLVEVTMLMSIKNEQVKEERLHVIKQLLAKGPYEDYAIEMG